MIYKHKPLTQTHSELGKKSDYDAHYNPDRLFPISRDEKRAEIGIDPAQLPFYGFDGWNHYEVSWLNEKGKPMVGTAEIRYDCRSPMIIESKSLKLYFNSFNNTSFKDISDVETTALRDLTRAVGAEVFLAIHPLGRLPDGILHASFSGESIDALDVSGFRYTVEPRFLVTSDEPVDETLYSDLLKSNCLVTYQPDWGSVQIAYKGPKIDREGLLKYIVSFRNHNEFHEQCIERIFMDIMQRCKPEALTVYGRYTRRGGLDINPYRS
ncbi:MAG TPA: NADPH-dependent 7-cyano-7-deazaguanine reductase QueF, partial [Legionella sp.]|nr:NADPH-dependent 7-cyano-7-deazaguanine reductase QueF [Legionella sp.]